jgi:hypothetical protein
MKILIPGASLIVDTATQIYRRIAAFGGGLPRIGSFR